MLQEALQFLSPISPDNFCTVCLCVLLEYFINICYNGCDSRLSFHLLHMMNDNYLLHTLEAHFEHLQESEYKKQMLSHYSESRIPYPIFHVSSIGVCNHQTKTTITYHLKNITIWYFIQLILIIYNEIWISAPQKWTASYITYRV